MSHPLVYEINTRCWLQELSRRNKGEVTLVNVPESEFLNWRQLGFTHVWLMGVWTTGPRSRAVVMAIKDFQEEAGRKILPDYCHTDIVGSPYAISLYRVPGILGGETGLNTFRQKLHKHGLKLLLDFVPNHVGLDHPWLSDRPALLVQSAEESPGTFARETSLGPRWLAYGKDPYFPPWIDTAQVDYRQSAARLAMQEQLLEIADRCDGVRCDMAMLVLNDIFAKTWAAFPVRVKTDQPSKSPVVSSPYNGGPDTSNGEFWDSAIAAVKQRHPDFVFLAETYWGLERRLQSLGFDYTYDKELYDELIRRNPAGVQNHLLSAPPEYVAASAHFLENHDEPRIASLLSPEEHRAAALMFLALPGMRLLHEGQLDGARIRIPVQFARRCVEDEQPELRKMYEHLLVVLRDSAVGKGRATLLRPLEAAPGNSTSQNVVLVQWNAPSSGFDLAAVNLSSVPSQCVVRPELDAGNATGNRWRVNNLLGEEQFEYSHADLREKGLPLDLPGYAARLFQFRRVV